MDLKKLLNPAQWEAVMHDDGPAMIVAGAGSGKTRVLTYRIARLMLEGTDPFRILALTFTNKAAREMKERIAAVVGESRAKNIWMGTFHSIFARILRLEADKLGYTSSFTIYDKDDSQKAVTSVIKELGLDKEIYKPRQVLNRISALKNRLITPDKYGDYVELINEDVQRRQPDFIRIYHRYNDLLFRRNVMDFDDLLLKTNELFEKYPEILGQYQRRFEHIMVDEFQDTNYSQYRIVRALADFYQNLTVVGDDSQSIYSFRGAEVKHFLNFMREFPGVTVYRLERNYRSTKHIVKASNSLIAHNKYGLKKELWTENEEGEKIRIMALSGDRSEASWIARDLIRRLEQKGLRYSDAVVLYRTNAQSRPLEDAFRAYGIPYRIYGGISFYQRREIKDVLAYLRLLVNPRDDEAFLRIINFPARGIGKKTLETLSVLADRHGLSLYELTQDIDRLAGGMLNARARNKLKDFAVMMEHFRIRARELPVDELAKAVIKRTGLLEAYRKEYDVDADRHIENVEALVNAMREFVESQSELADGDPGLERFLSEVALQTDMDMADDDENAVTLMTLHMSKGLEFPVVYISGLEEGLLPAGVTMFDRENLEEERRLMYVGMTRAKKLCTLTYARSRMRWGTVYESEPSRFLSEIDEAHVQWLRQPPADSPPAPAEPASPARRGISRTIRPSNLKPLKRAAKGGAPPVRLAEGDRVRHERFGNGTVKKVVLDGENSKATVEFDYSGTKVLLLRFAKLTRL
ncbi:MAG: UvrD-helicase domain-containing protein [Chlorobi bacterium]|nr:UvrD-helicase domain-containing protein [Chlorobiota bacterium]